MCCRCLAVIRVHFRSLAIVFLLVNPAILLGAGRLIINEIMINEPGSETSLEWVELFNAGEDSLDLKYYVFIEASDTTRFASHWISSREFVVLARKPVSADGSASFERQWGNASNSWGDDSLENFLLLPAKMSLRNSNDSVTIVDLSSGRLETVKWSTSPPDGVSLERVNPATDANTKNFKYCKSTALCSPGKANSVVAKLRDWGFIEDDCEIFVPPSPEQPLTFSLMVANFGQLEMPAFECRLILDRNFDGIFGGQDSVLKIHLDMLRPDSTAIISPSLFTTVGRHAFVFQLPEDDDISNNTIRFECVVGSIAPELLISEFLNNAPDSIGCEWIEVQSVVPYIVSLSGWSLEIDGKAGSLDSLGCLEPGDMMIICQDSTRFRAGNSGFNCQLIQPTQWRSLGNTQGAIALRMHLGALSDSIEYRGAIESGRSWERDFDSTAVAFESLFYRSTAIGGSTPCNENSVRPIPVAHDVGFVDGSLKLEPDSFNHSKVIASFRLVNLGYRDSPWSAIQVFDDTNRDGIAHSDELIFQDESVSIPARDSINVTIPVPVSAGRRYLMFTLPDDENLANNLITGTITAGNLTREVVVTEFLADPSGALETEWIEIKNNSAFPVDLTDWQFGDLAHQNTLESARVIGAGEYCLVAQDANAFARYYGSGCAPLECRTWSYLNNSGDCIVVRDEFGTISDSASFLYVAGENRSIERNEQETPGLPTWNSSIAPLGATPCSSNSTRPVPAACDAGFVENAVTIGKDSLDVELLYFRARVANLGYRDLSHFTIGIYDDKNRDEISSDEEFLTQTEADSLVAGDTTTVEFTLRIPAGRHVLIFQLPHDEVDENNYCSAEITSGMLLHEIIITEFLADPTNPLESEWIEIRNVTEYPIELRGWSIGDLSHQNLIAAALSLEAQDYCVIAQDDAAFERYYVSGCTPLALTSWSSLNNGGDCLILRDEFGTISDSVSYPDCAGENRSLERNESEPVASSRWYPSTSLFGATPCAANSVSGSYSGEISFSLINRVFAPSAGENLQFSIQCPPASKFTIEVFDLAGRRQKLIADAQYFSSGEFSYDGASDHNAVLPIGAYIMKVEKDDGSFSRKAGFAVAPPK